MEQTTERLAPQPKAVGELMQLLSLTAKEGSNLPPDAEAIEQVELTEEEERQALHKVKAEKWWQLREQQVKDARDAVARERLREWGPQDMMNYLPLRARELNLKDFRLDEYNSYVIEALCRYFTNDETFEQMGLPMGKDTTPQQWKLDKGLLLFGHVGTGKTTLLRLFGHNQRASYDKHSCPEVVRIFLQEGNGPNKYDVIEHTFLNNRPLVRDIRTFNQEMAGRFFDDLGKEEPVNLYGNKRDVMAEILDGRHERRYQYGFVYTHATTNLSRAQLEQRYGTRVWSRMQEMFNFINLEGPDRRVEQ